MTNEAEDRVSKFYNTVGWETDGEVTEDAKRWEDLREHAREYVTKCRLRVLNHIPEEGLNMLDMASGPIQYKEYLEYSKNFKKRYCVDLSLEALESAKRKIGDRGEFLHGSFFDIPLDENFFDCTISLHTIYHIDKNRQEEAVRKLIKVTKPGKPVIIVYSNPNSLRYFWKRSIFSRAIRRMKRLMKKSKATKQKGESLNPYFYAHPIEWWHRFEDVADVMILPWRSFASDVQQKLIPDNGIGEFMFRILFNLEDKFPDFFVKYFQYPMIILTKKD
jgi:ubiquinone/menaquinone biosynthesis C-methylase UbiE